MASRLARLLTLAPRAWGPGGVVHKTIHPLRILFSRQAPTVAPTVAKGLITTRVLVAVSRPTPPIFSQLQTSTRALSSVLAAWRSRLPTGRLIQRAFGPRPIPTVGLAACLVLSQVTPVHTEASQVLHVPDIPLAAVALRLTAKGGILYAPRDPKDVLAVTFGEVQRLHAELSRQRDTATLLAYREECLARMRTENAQMRQQMAERERRLRGELEEEAERARKEAEHARAEHSRLLHERDREKECVVCLSEPRGVVFGCGHHAVCRGCDSMCHACPICRCDIAVRVPYYSP